MNVENDMRRILATAACCALLSLTAHAAVPLTWDSTGHIVVPTLVNDKGPFTFMVDTGADESAVYSWFAKSLDLPEGRAGELSGAIGSEKMISTILSSLSVDGHRIKQIDADTLPDRADGVKLAGIVGVDLMSDRLATIDFACRTFELRPVQRARPEIVGTDATLIKAGAIRDGKQLTLPVIINGVVGVAVLDTGAKYTDINRKFAASAGIDVNSIAFRDGKPARGATAASIATRIGPIGTVHFAGIVRRDAVARVVNLPYFEGAGLADKPTMNLGLDFLQGTRLTVDFSSRQFWLAPSSCPLSPDQHHSAQ
jgi:predicted aspartyl protease